MDPMGRKKNKTWQKLPARVGIKPVISRLIPPVIHLFRPLIRVITSSITDVLTFGLLKIDPVEIEGIDTLTK